MSNKKIDGIKKIKKEDKKKSREIVLKSINEEIKKIAAEDKVSIASVNKTVDSVFSSFSDNNLEKKLEVKERKKVNDSKKEVVKVKENSTEEDEKKLITEKKIIKNGNVKKDDLSLEEKKQLEMKKHQVLDVLGAENKNIFIKESSLLEKKAKDREDSVFVDEQKSNLNDVVDNKKLNADKKEIMQFLQEEHKDKIEQVRNDKIKNTEEKKSGLGEEEIGNISKSSNLESKEEDLKIKEEEKEKARLLKKEEKMKLKIAKKEAKIAEKEKEIELKKKEKQEKEKIAEKERQKKIDEEIKKHEEEEKKRNLLKKENELKRKRKEKEKKIKIQNKKKNKELRKKKLRDIRKNISSVCISSIKHFFKVFKEFVYIIFIVFNLFIVGYFLFAIVVLKFDVDMPLFRDISQSVPIPAFVTKNGVVEYYRYYDLKQEIKDSYSNLDVQEMEKIVKVELVKKIIFEDLAREYGLEGEDNLIEKMQKKIAFDEEINQVAFSRIQKIKFMFNSGHDFIKTAIKYGDQTGSVTVDNNGREFFSFGKDVINMQVGDISDVINTPEGYYIFRCVSRDSQEVNLNYVFMRSKTLDDYISEVAGNYKIWSLVD